MAGKMENCSGIFLLDNSYTEPHEDQNLSRLLFEGRGGLELIEPEQIERRVLRLSEIQRIIAEFDVGVIKEVLSEMLYHLKIINQQHTFLKKQLYNDQRYKRGHLNKKSDLSERTQEVILEKIRGYSNVLYRTADLCRGRDPRKQFDKSENKRYIYFLKRLKELFKEDDRRHAQDSELLKNNSNAEVPLYTDAKLIATAYTLSSSYPVTIITRDREMSAAIESLDMEVRLSPYFRQVCMPGNSFHSVDVFDENLSGRTFMEYYEIDGE